MSWFSVQPPPSASSNTNSEPQETINPVTSRYNPDGLFGQLSDEDTAWIAQTSGFVTETQTFYITLPEDRLVMCQVIHSSVGLWYPQIQFTFRYYDPHHSTHVWKSTNVTNFKPAPSFSNSKVSYDRRSCKSDQFSILLDPAQPDTYTLTGKHDDGVELAFTVTRLPGVPGWKLGHDAQGGFTYFGLPTGSKPPSSGSKPDTTAGADGYVVHRFWPRCSLTGELIIQGQRIRLEEGRAIFIHAIQGMRPNLIASRWNFCNFQSLPSQSGDDPGVSLTTMEFTTVPGTTYGPAQTITVGSVVVGDKLLSVTGSPDARVTHEAPLTLDTDTGYQAPAGLKFVWNGPMIEGDGQVQARLDVRLKEEGQEGYQTKGLIEKVDVMAQIPYLIKKFVATVAGARPYIYTWINPAEATIEIPSSSDPSGVKKIVVTGSTFNEASFVSDL